MESVALNYKKLGEGEPLIILHGLFGSLDNWMTLAKKWAEKYEVWLVDQRNHGKSPHTDQHSYSLMAEDLLQFLKEHNIEKANVLGHSMGGKTAMEFAMQHPDKVDKLIVVDIAPVSYEVHHWRIINALESVDLKAITSRKEAEQQLAKKIEEQGVRLFLLKNLDRLGEGEYQWKFNLHLLKEEIVPISEWAISEGEFVKKTLFIKGENSNYILAEYGAAIAKKFPNYQVEEIEKAGHWVHAEAPKAFFEIVNQFLEK
ncbi:MAG: alpha/beta fold hydrolase [Vicingaceae bacterium]